MSYPSAIAKTRGRRDNTGESDDGNDAEQHLDDLGGRRARTHRGVRLRSIGWNRAADRHQRADADQGQRLGSSSTESSPTPLTHSSAKCSSLMASRRSTSL